MEPGEKQRIDKWLFFARVVKSRSLAARLVASGAVRVNREKTSQPSHTVRVGDVLTITLARRILVYRILAAGTRRGPAGEARLLYEDLSPEPVPAAQSQTTAPRETGSGRPTKRERRLTDRLRGETEPD